jgi:hypothetical protein
MTFTHSSIERVGLPVALQTCIREVLDSKLGRVTGCLKRFHESGQMLGKHFET